MTISYASAGLPMYDWPEVRSSTDLFWAGICASLASRGITAPQTLAHHADIHALWLRPDLLLAQTCGLPFVQGLKDHVRLIGTPAYEIDCAAGQYFSNLIVPQSSSLSSLAGFSGRVAVNSLDSQSGYAALLQALADANGATPFRMSVVLSGSHRDSIRMVSRGEVDLAAIDAVSFVLAERHMPETAGVRVIGRTEPTPGLPYVTALPEGDVDRLRAALAEAIAELDPHVRHALLLTGFVPLEATDYDVIASRWQALQGLIPQTETAAAS